MSNIKSFYYIVIISVLLIVFWTFYFSYNFAQITEKAERLEENSIVVNSHNLKLLESYKEELKAYQIAYEAEITINELILNGLNKEYSLEKIYDYIDISLVPHQLSFNLKGSFFHDTIFFSKMDLIKYLDLKTILNNDPAAWKITFFFNLINEKDFDVFLPTQQIEIYKRYLKSRLFEFILFNVFYLVMFFISILFLSIIVFYKNEKKLLIYLNCGGKANLLKSYCFFTSLKITLLNLAVIAISLFLFLEFKFKIDIFTALNKLNAVILLFSIVVSFSVVFSIMMQVKKIIRKGNNYDEVHT